MFAMDENGTAFSAPQEILHTKTGMDDLVQRIRTFPDETKAVLESTEYYHWPVVFSLLDADIFISIVNTIVMSKFYYANSLLFIFLLSSNHDSLKISKLHSII